MNVKRCREFGIAVGSLPTGPRDKISDVPGVTVGHCTVDTPENKTGVTVLLPCKENPFTHKLPAGAWVMNGFGKTAGLVQIDELGTLESPIAFTNTLNVGLVHDALVEYLCMRCEADGVPLSSVNPIVCECNDADLNDIRHRVVTQSHVFSAIEDASADFAEGDVGGGKGTICHDLKGGIGSASRRMAVDGKSFTMGALVQTNHGCLSDLTIGGVPIGKKLAEAKKEHTPDQGSVIVLLSTDLPLDARQLRRVARRASVGLARLGSYAGHGSGEIFIAFSTANPQTPADDHLRTVTAYKESGMDLPFRAAAECVEEAVLNSMLTAHSVTGRTGKCVPALLDVWSPTL